MGGRRVVVGGGALAEIPIHCNTDDVRSVGICRVKGHLQTRLADFVASYVIIVFVSPKNITDPKDIAYVKCVLF